VLAYNESCEIVDLFDLWQGHADAFPGLREYLREVCRKGPTLREGEKPSASSNRPRNDAFACLVAGTLVNAGVRVVAVGGMRRTDFIGNVVADVTLSLGGSCIDLECKRPQGESGLVPLLRKARAQLEEPTRERRPGIVAIDCSAIVRPPGSLLEYESGQNPEGQVSALLQAFPPTCDPCLTPQLLGLLLFARMAGMMRMGQSPVLSPGGRPIHEFRPETIKSWLAVSNAQAPGGNTLREIAMRIHRHQQTPRRPPKMKEHGAKRV